MEVFAVNAASVMPPSVSLNAFKDEIHIAFVIQNDYFVSYASPWFQLAAGRQLGDLAYEASQAFCHSVFGNAHHLPGEVFSADEQYGAAICQLNQSLSGTALLHTPSLLIVILLLLMQSSANRSIEESEVHINGMRRLLLLCGPKSFQRQPLLAAYKACRAVLTSHALDHKQALFLEGSNWCSIPWSLADVQKSSLDHLGDIFVALPSLQESFQLLPNASLDSKLHLLDRVLCQLERLSSWRTLHGHEYSHLASEEKRDASSTTQYCAYYPAEADRLLRFADTESAVTMSMYNAILLALSTLLTCKYLNTESEMLLARFSDDDVSYNVAELCDTLVPPVTTGLLDPLNIAMQIGRAFDYHLHYTNHFTTAAVYWLWPLGLAHHTLRDDPVWSEWIRLMLATSRSMRMQDRGLDNDSYGLYLIERCEAGLL